jgi:hypothetical protein
LAVSILASHVQILRASANSGARRQEIADHAKRHAGALLRNCFSPRVDHGVDMIVTFRKMREVELALIFEHCRKPGIVTRQLAFTTVAPAGFRARKKSSMASDFRRGFQLDHSSEASARMVGRSNDRLRALSVWASSTQAIRNPSSDLIDSEV